MGKTKRATVTYACSHSFDRGTVEIAFCFVNHSLHEYVFRKLKEEVFATQVYDRLFHSMNDIMRATLTKTISGNAMIMKWKVYQILDVHAVQNVCLHRAFLSKVEGFKCSCMRDRLCLKMEGNDKIGVYC